jgi:cohesin complex subunit SCC1
MPWVSILKSLSVGQQCLYNLNGANEPEAILTHDEGPVTLRLSGQLMLGVTRIYSRKAQSLFEDCRYTRENITKVSCPPREVMDDRADNEAFRPGVVDLPEDQQRTNNNAITLADTRNDFDFFDWSWSSAMPPPPINRETSGPSRQYLRAQTREYGAYNFGRMAPGSIYGGSTPSRQSQDGDDTSKLDSQDFRPIDLELGLDNAEVIPDNVSDLLPITGRRQSTAGRRSMSGLRDSRDKSIDPNFGMEDFPEMPELDLNLDIDIGALSGLDGEARSRRECK